MFHPPTNPLHAAVAYRTTTLDVWRGLAAQQL
jgi:hypothetical protein